MTAAAPTSEGYQEHGACRNCKGNGTWIRIASARGFVPRGTLLGRSSCGSVVYVWTKCRSCGGSGFEGTPSRFEALAWAAQTGFRWPAASEPGYAVRGVVRGPGSSVECDAAAGILPAR